MSLETEVCRALPFDAVAIFPSHSALAGLVAGFAITGFVLYLNQGQDVEPDNDVGGAQALAERRATAAMLFAFAGIVGSIAAYLFSALSGDHCLLAQIEFVYPSVLLAVTGLLMLGAIASATAAVPSLRSTAVASRSLLWGVTALLMIRLALDLSFAAAMTRGLNALGVDSINGVERTLNSLSDVDVPPGGTKAEHIAAILLEADVGLINTLALWSVGLVTTATTGALLVARYHTRLREASYARSALGTVLVIAVLGILVLFSVEVEMGGVMLEDSTVRWGGLLLAQGVISALIVTALQSPDEPEPKAKSRARSVPPQHDEGEVECDGSAPPLD